MSRLGEFFYDEQIKRYALQFNAIFSGMMVKTGKTDKRDVGFIPVPIVYASMDRVAAAAATGHTQNKHIRLPMMSSNIVNYDIATDRMKGTGSLDRQVFVPLGGTLPNDAKVIRRRMAVPYDFTFDLHLYASNKDQQFQMLEQIMPLFDPILQIQTSESHFDTAKIVTVELISINNEENFPPGTESRQLVTTIQFKVDAYITIPATVKDDVVRKVYARVSAVSGGGIGTIMSDGSNNMDIPALYDELDIDPILMSTAFIDDVDET
jgi:hypothetical protein